VSFFKKMFGGSTAEEERSEADRLFGTGEAFGARQAYERALEKSRGGPTELRAHCEARIAECYDLLAEQRMIEAERFREDGELELARTELASAIELARTPAVRERARRASEMLERKDAVALATEVPELDDEERWAVIAGTWEEAQMEEYDDYGEPFRQALLALHDTQQERPSAARGALEAILEENADDAIYLWLEVGRARLLDKDEAGGAKALRRFLKRLPDEDRSDARLGAYLALASLADRNDGEEKAISLFQKAIDAMPDDPRAYLQLGVYLRQKGHAEEAIEVLDTAIALLDEERPSWEAYQELGLAKMDAGRDEEAAALLERVVRHFASRSHLDFPRSTAFPLAKLHEKAGRLEKAADLYRGLANGSDRANHLEYHREAARVLTELGLLDEARRMLTRAAALARESPDALAEIEAKIAAIDAEHA
jgi:tetratricopeptide (TPR) repeat protein